MSEPTLPIFERIGGRPELLKLLRHFYADVRQHTLLGPIFKTHIQDWPAHHEKIADFWSGLTGGPATYGGGMVMKHLTLGIGEVHFEAWLGLWKRTCATHLAEAEASDMIGIAEKVGGRLRAILANRNQPSIDLFSQ